MHKGLSFIYFESTEITQGFHNMDLEILVSIAQIVGAIATAAAFWATWLSLREMRRQTDLSNNPTLKVRFQHHLSQTSNYYITQGVSILDCHELEDPHRNWLNIITRNFDQDLSALDDSFLTLDFSNAGKSEITRIQFTYHLHVIMFEGSDEILGIPLAETSYDEEFDFISELSEREHLYVPLTNTRYFPIYHCSISNLKYTDVRGDTYTNFDGSSSLDDITNEILRPRLMPAEPDFPPIHPRGKEGEQTESENQDEAYSDIPF